MAGRHNGHGHSSFGTRGHFGGRGGGSHSNPTESYHPDDTANPVPVTTLSSHMLNAWGHNTHPSSWGTVPCANPTENTSAQEISVVTNPPAGQLVTFVPTTQQQIADHHHRGMCDNSDAIYNDSLSISLVHHHLNNIVYLQLEYTMDTAVAVMRDIYNCIDGHDVPHTYQGPIPVSCFTSKVY